MMGAFLSRTLVMVLGYAYPAYECYKTVELNKPEIEKLRFWCQYWILVALLAVFERVGDIFISWLPMYSEAKLAFYIYLWSPRTRGTTYVYETFFKPLVAKHETEIDRNLLELRLRAGDMMVFGWQKAASYGQTRFLEILHYVASQSQVSRTRSVQHQQPQEHHQVKTHKDPSAVSPAAQSAAPQHQEEPSSTTVLASQPAPPRQTQQATKVPPSPTRGQGQRLEQSTKSAPSLLVSPAKSKASDSNPVISGSSNIPRPIEEPIQVETDDPPTTDDSNATEETAMEEAIRATRSRLRKRAGAGLASVS